MLYLIQNFNIKQSRFEINSQGEEDPLRSNRSLLSQMKMKNMIRRSVII